MRTKILLITIILLFAFSVNAFAVSGGSVVWELKEDFSGLENNQSFTTYKNLTNEWLAEKAVSYDGVGDNGSLHFGAFTQLILKRQLTGPYVFSTDLNVPNNQFFGVFVRSTGEYLSGVTYFEHDGILTPSGADDNEGIGATGIYVIPRANRMILCIKTADMSKNKNIGTDKTSFDLDCNFESAYTNLKFEDDGDTVKIYAANKLVCYVELSEPDSKDYMSTHMLYRKAEIYGANGQKIKTVNDCRICAEYSTLAYGLRISSANIDNIYVCEYEGNTTVTEAVIGISRVDIKRAPEKTEYLVGEELDLSGMYLEITYENKVKKDVKITADMVEGFDNTTTGVKQLTVNYENRTAVYSVKVVDEYSPETEKPRETIDFDTSPATSVSVNESNGMNTTVIIIIIIAVVVVCAVIAAVVIKSKKSSANEDKI